MRTIFWFLVRSIQRAKRAGSRPALSGTIQVVSDPGGRSPAGEQPSGLSDTGRTKTVAEAQCRASSMMLLWRCSVIGQPVPKWVNMDNPASITAQELMETRIAIAADTKIFPIGQVSDGASRQNRGARARA